MIRQPGCPGLLQRLAGVVHRSLHQRPFLAPLRYKQVDGPAAALREPRFDQVGVGDGEGQEKA